MKSSKELLDLTAVEHEHEYGRAGERALAEIRAMIWNGELQPDQHLRQDALAQEFGISRVPVREIFKGLVAEGILVHRPNHGHYVADLSSHELAQICWLRDALESRLAFTAVWPSTDQLDEIRATNSQMMDHKLEGIIDKAPIITLDTQFHDEMWNLSSEKLMIPELRRIWGRIAPYRSVMGYEPYVVQRMHDEHEVIIEAIAAQDRDAFMAALAAHSTHTQGVIEALRQKEILAARIS